MISELLRNPKEECIALAQPFVCGLRLRPVKFLEESTTQPCNQGEDFDRGEPNALRARNSKGLKWLEHLAGRVGVEPSVR